jgi:hypothetical protein
MHREPSEPLFGSRHHEAVAAALAKHRGAALAGTVNAHQLLCRLQDAFTDLFAADDSRFDRDWFDNACAPPQADDDLPSEPEDGDYLINASSRGGHDVSRWGGKYLGNYSSQAAARAAIREHMDGEQSFANVWLVSGHGNSYLCSIRAD